MKQKSTTTAVDARFEERKKYYLEQFFQDEAALEKAINAELWDECTVDFIRNRMMSFVHKFYHLEDGGDHEHLMMADMMRREGGRIVDYLYRAVRSNAEAIAHQRAKKEFAKGDLSESP